MGGEGVARDARMAKRHSVRTALVGESLRRTVLGAVRVCCACESAENAGRRLAAMLAPHSLCPRHARQSLDCLRWRVLCVCSTITAPSALFPGISRGCTWRSVRRQFRSSRFCRIRFNRAIRSAWHLRHLALRRCASLCNISASAQADSACAERNAPPLASATLPPRSTQATAPHARSLPYSTCWRIAPPPMQHQSFSLLLRYGGGTPPLNQAELRDGR